MAVFTIVGVLLAEKFLSSDEYAYRIPHPVHNLSILSEGTEYPR